MVKEKNRIDRTESEEVEPRYISIKDFCKITGLSYHGVWRNLDEIRHIRIGRRYLIDRNFAEELMS